jgi:hypothetical protein
VCAVARANKMRVVHKPISDAKGQVRPTTVIESSRLGKHLGVNLILASETFQHTGMGL